MLLPGPLLLPLAILPYPLVPWLFLFLRRRVFFLSSRGGDACIALAGQAFSHRGRCKHPLPTSAPPPLSPRHILAMTGQAAPCLPSLYYDTEPPAELNRGHCKGRGGGVERWGRSLSRSPWNSALASITVIPAPAHRAKRPRHYAHYHAQQTRELPSPAWRDHAISPALPGLAQIPARLHSDAGIPRTSLDHDQTIYVNHCSARPL